MSAWRIVAPCTNTCSHTSGRQTGSDPYGVRPLYELGEIGSGTGDLVGVQLELAFVGASALPQVADEDEPFQVQDEIVELRHHAASSSTTSSSPRVSASDAGRVDRTSVRVISAPASSRPVST